MKTGARLAALIACACLLVAASACDGEGTGRSEAPPTGSSSGEEARDMLRVMSSAYSDGGRIPVANANLGVEGGQNLSIPLSWEGVPADTASFALVLIDRDARDFVHWMVTDIPAGTTRLAEGASSAEMPSGAVEHVTTFGTRGYGGPEPPVGSGEHAYELTLYALDVANLGLPPDASLAEFLHAVERHELAKARLTGYFGR